MNDTKSVLPQNFTRRFACRGCADCGTVTETPSGFTVNCNKAGEGIEAILRADLLGRSLRNCPYRNLLADPLTSGELKKLHVLISTLSLSDDPFERHQQIGRLENTLRLARDPVPSSLLTS